MTHAQSKPPGLPKLVFTGYDEDGIACYGPSPRRSAPYGYRMARPDETLLLCIGQAAILPGEAVIVRPLVAMSEHEPVPTERRVPALAAASAGGVA